MIKTKECLNLLDKLKPEYLEKLKEIDIDRPFTFRLISEELEENIFWTDLKYSIIINLYLNLNLKDLNPNTIDSLFTNEND